MKDRLYIGLAIGVGACLIVVGGWYIYNSKFSDRAKLENCADRMHISYNMFEKPPSGSIWTSKKTQKKRKEAINGKSLKYKLNILNYNQAFEKYCFGKFKDNPHTFRIKYQK